MDVLFLCKNHDVLQTPPGDAGALLLFAFPVNQHDSCLPPQ